MPQEKQIKDRIYLVSSIYKITRAMKMVAIAKIEKLKRELAHISSLTTSLEQMMHKSVQHNIPGLKRYFVHRPQQKSLYILCASDKGLCGSFNNILFKKAEEIYLQTEQKEAISFLAIGKKAEAFLQKKQYPYQGDYVDLYNDLDLDQVNSLQHFLLQHFMRGSYGSIFFIYQTHRQKEGAIVERILPCSPIKKMRQTDTHNIIYEPSGVKIAQYIYPRLCSLHLYKKLLTGQLAEHTYRMISMSQATDNAADLVKELRTAYNRMRQTAITRGIIEVTAGLK